MNAVLSPSIPRPDVLFLEDEQQSAALVPALRQNYTVAVTSMPAAAREYLRRIRPALIVMDLDLDGDAADDICREAKKAEPSPAPGDDRDNGERAGRAGRRLRWRVVEAIPAESVLREDRAATPRGDGSADRAGTATAGQASPRRRADHAAALRDEPGVARRALPVLQPPGRHELRVRESSPRLVRLPELQESVARETLGSGGRATGAKRRPALRSR
jgi:CheY-like chemotaxis protein